MSLGYGFRVAPKSICSLVPKVCQAIYDEYHQELIECPASQKDGNKWRKVSLINGISTIV